MMPCAKNGGRSVVPSPISVPCTEITLAVALSPISVQYADNLSWVHGVLRVLHINVPKFFERPLITVELRGRHFEIVRSPPRFPLGQPRIRLTPAVKTLW